MVHTKRIISLLLAVLLLVALFPAGALITDAQAATENFYSFDLLTEFPDGPFTSDTNSVAEQKDDIRAYFDGGKIGSIDDEFHIRFSIRIHCDYDSTQQKRMQTQMLWMWKNTVTGRVDIAVCFAVRRRRRTLRDFYPAF